MFYMTISDKDILDFVGSIRVFQKGIACYQNGRVNNVRYNRDEMAADASVIDEEIYNTHISFHRDGTINSAYCTCTDYMADGAPCKHAAALLKYIQQANRSRADVMNLPSYRDKVKSRAVNNNIFTFFENFHDEEEKRPVRLEVVYELSREMRGSISSIELKLGEDRLYVVRSIKEFLEAVKNYRLIEFGKKFSFNPNESTFCEEDRAIIDLLFELLENEKLMQNSVYYGSNPSVFKGKKAYISDYTLKRLFNILKNRRFEARIFESEIRGMTIVEGPLPLEFDLSRRREDIVLNWSLEHTLTPLTRDGEYYFYDGRIYHPPKKQVRYFAPLFEAYMNNRQSSLTFSSWEKERFVSEVLPYIKSIGEVNVDVELENSLCQGALKAGIYFDKIEEGISAKIEFDYDGSIINPFMGKQTISHGEKIVIREVEKERKIIGIFENTGFKVSKDRIHLDDEDRIFEFVYNTLPKLQELADIYYSDAFKSMNIKSSRKITGGVRLNQSMNMLEFSFELEGVDNEELKYLFDSIREKRKYHRLRDGSFIPLNDPQLTSIADIIEYLDISDRELKKKAIALPKYRAMYLDSQLEEGSLHSIERNAAFRQLVQSIGKPEDMDFAIPESLSGILRDYQKVGFRWMKTLAACGMGGILADDMGLGKTLQTIAFIMSEKEKNAGPSLVIAPTSLVYNWQEEVRKFAPELNVVVVYGPQGERQQLLEEIEGADIVVTSYPLIRRDIELYEKFEFACCILDEAQHIKNPDTQNAQAVKQIKARGYFALTGTPIENSLTELWSIFDFVMPGYLLNHGKFMRMYEKPIMKYRDEKVLAELSRQIRPFILRRMKRDVLKELPEKIESKLTAELTEQQAKLYAAYINEARGEISRELQDKGFERSQIRILAALTRLRQICCHPATFMENYQGDSGKMLLLEEILEEALSSGHRILLFSQFTSMLGLIRQLLERHDVDYFYLDGSTGAEDRSEMVKMFESGRAKVFLISLKAGGTGLNLTGADMVIHFDPWWNPAVEDQATDRAYRIGQKNTVQVLKLITKGTIEEKIYLLQQKKKKMIDAVIQPGETLLTKLSEQEIRELFDI